MAGIGYGRQRQADIYLAGVRGEKPRVPQSAATLEQQAERAMSKEGFAYIAGGAGLETTLKANRAAFERVRIVPRMLRGPATRELGIELFGRTLPAPLLLAPIGVLEMAHRDADVAVARAAAAEGVPMIFSSQASRALEECAAAMGDAPRWFQLYMSTSDDLVRSFVSRAERAGCEAIVVTLDTTMLGWRLRDLDLGYLPFLAGKGIAQYVTDPVFQRLVDDAPPPERGAVTPGAVRALWRLARAYPGSTWANLRSPRPRQAVRTFLDVFARPSLNWHDLALVRDATKLPILLKGILHPDDARRALDEGVDGIVVSNHGGRQVDGSVGSLDVLPAIAEAVGGRAPILLDSGIRGGADVFKALALGATAVLIGRPYCYGLAVAGESGVREVIQNFIADLDLTLGLSGCASLAEVGGELVEIT
ncbi:MAG: lactate 2-monooxygenase [Actinobacteria bacterium]|nr:MAG: lactate 2-monooxygenase [Actinomycetota bacterium]TML86241.1 MAG: lactate 2-monooxygenase [Actinomycetota bacterium]